MLQVIHKPGRTRIEFLDWSELPEDGHEERLQALHKREREAGFDLLEQPPFHLRLIRLGEARYWFMMSNHHILIDAWCRGLLMNDFFEIYGALGEPPGEPADAAALPATTSPGCNARTWSNRVAGGASLRGFERPTLVPSDRPFLREHAGESGGMIVGDRYASGRRRRARLRELAQRYQLTVNTFAQAAWALTLRASAASATCCSASPWPGVRWACRKCSAPSACSSTASHCACRCRPPASAARCANG